ncbi:MbnP family protein [Hymenobacter agri]
MKFSALSAGLFAVASFSLIGCKKDEAVPNQKGTVDLAFEQTVGTAPLTLSTQTYTTPAGDQFKITTFKQYISNIKLNKTDGTTYAVPESYFLLDASNVSTLELPLKDIPVGDYKSLTFTVGVDSARNVSGAQTGALDPSNAMFWTWNSGYIYTKLEGTSPQAPKQAGATEGGLVFHIGGFKSPNNTIRTVTVPFPTGTNLLVRTDHAPEVHLNADIMKMFTGPNTVRFATLSNTMGGANSVLVANNYAAGMFSVEHIHAN